MFDILFRRAKIVDGTGNPWRYGDVAVKDGVIVAVGTLPADAEAARVFNLDHHVLCPGFIDGHSHSELLLLSEPEARAKIMQGVTTENLGLDSMSVAPIRDEDKESWRTYLSGLAGSFDVPWNWNSFADYLDRLEEIRTSVNVSSYVGLGTLRLAVMGMTDRPAGPDELALMREAVAEAMRQGARGVSAGLIYPPNQYQTESELVVLCRAAAEYGGIFDVHMRNEADDISASIDEVARIGEAAGIPTLITHFKARGRRNWGRAEELLAQIDAARARGVDLTIAQYPYTAGSTLLHAVIPPWYHRRGQAGLLEALRTEKERIKKDIRERRDWENISELVGWDNIFISSVHSDRNAWCEGKSVADIAGVRGLDDPADAACDLLYEEKLAVGQISFGLCEEDVKVIMKHSTVSFITDGLQSGGKPHPRTYGTYPRILGRYVREQRVLSLEEAVRKMSSLPARKLGLARKGVIAEGYDADIVVFDENTILDTNSYEQPRIHPQGIEHVFVNGAAVVEQGAHTGARPGRTIRRQA